MDRRDGRAGPQEPQELVGALVDVARAERLKCERGASPVRCTQLPLTAGAFFKATENLAAGQGIPVWITLRNDLVERIDEQYFP